MSKSQNKLNIEKMQKRMEEIEGRFNSKSVCMAKWLQSTVYLMNGQTHSCHHPPTHKIPEAEIKANPSALHNTKYKKQQRAMMLKGERPPECQYCWNIEDLEQGYISDRVYKSSDPTWSYPYLQKVLDSKEGNTIFPTYFEVAFENTCNMKCMYCSPDISSKWMEEIVRFGPYTETSNQVGNINWLKTAGKLPLSKTEENIYVDAFWKWWPTLYSNLDTFRITGGEPLLSKNTWKVFEEIEKSPREGLTLAINTNFQVQNALFDKFIDHYNSISKKIKSFEVYTSCEAHGQHAEYIRTGLNYNSFINNINKFLSNTHSTSRLNLMITFNILSLSTFDLFLEDIWTIRCTHNLDSGLNRLPMMINYLRWPQFQDMRLAPAEIKRNAIKKIVDYVMSHAKDTSPNLKGRFYLEEIDQINRLAAYMTNELPKDEYQKQKKDFSGFFREFDKRRQTSLLKHFPELEHLYQPDTDF